MTKPFDGSWWRSAAIYQVYVRSFADGGGDGIGDLAGVRARLPYLATSVSTPSGSRPGTLAAGRRRLRRGGLPEHRPGLRHPGDAEALIPEALELGIRMIVDIVPNHVSSAHPWFAEALGSPPGSPSRDDSGSGPAVDEGREAPTDWVSNFGGPTWTRAGDADGKPGEWYLHLFSPEQPDLNWDHPEVRAEHEAVLRFWFDRGVAGIRIDSAALLVKEPALPEVPDDPHPVGTRTRTATGYTRSTGVAPIADAYRPPRVLVGEVWLADPERFARYLRPDEMHTAFNFDFMARRGMPRRCASRSTRHSTRTVRWARPATWVLSNHDVTRPVTRYGREDTAFAFATKRFGGPDRPGAAARGAHVRRPC